jgi:tRNA-dihydrouridine synthase B
MKLGTLSLENNLMLAPLLEVTSAPYRRFCRKLNKIGMVCVPMLYTKRVEKSPHTIEHLLHKIEEERPLSIQLIGSNIEALKKSIAFLESYKFDVLDINAGCPSKRAIKAEEGGYLLKDLPKLKLVLDTVIKHSSFPVSLKIRTGFNSKNTKGIVKIIEQSGIEFLTIHGRTVRDKFDETKLDLDSIHEVKSLLSIPIVGNGDIDSYKTAKEFSIYTEVDALMIGRGSIGNPTIFKQIENMEGFKNNRSIMQKNIILYEQCIDEYLEGISKFPYIIERYKYTELKRNAIWLTKNIPNSRELRIKLGHTKNLSELRTRLNEIFSP